MVIVTIEKYALPSNLMRSRILTDVSNAVSSWRITHYSCQKSGIGKIVAGLATYAMDVYMI